MHVLGAKFQVCLKTIQSYHGAIIMISPNQDTNLRLNFGKLNLKRISTIVKRAYLKKRFLSFAHATFVVCVSSYGRGRRDIYLHKSTPPPPTIVAPSPPPPPVHVSMATVSQLNYCTSTNGRGRVLNIVLVLHDLIFNCR